MNHYITTKIYFIAWHMYNIAIREIIDPCIQDSSKSVLQEHKCTQLNKNQIELLSEQHNNKRIKLKR